MSAYSIQVLNDSPALYWRLNDTTGTTITDSSGNARTGTYNGGFTLSSPGAMVDGDFAVALNGTTGVLTSSYNPFTVNSSRSYEFWLNRTNTSTGDMPMSDSTGAASSHVLLTCESGSNDMKFWPDTAGANALWTGAMTGTGVWVHVVLLHNDTAHTSELYINGVSKGVVSSMPAYSGSAGNFVCGDRGGVGGDNFFLGSVDDVAIYTSILTPARITAHYFASTRGSLPESMNHVGNNLRPAIFKPGLAR